MFVEQKYRHPSDVNQLVDLRPVGTISRLRVAVVAALANAVGLSAIKTSNWFFSAVMNELKYLNSSCTRLSRWPATLRMVPVNAEDPVA